MHYIVGTSVLVSETAARQDTGPVSITDMRSKTRRVENKTPFQTGVEYTLYNIRKNGELLQYKFSDQTGNVVDLHFATVLDADNYIAAIRGEALPDYESFHRNNRS